jgi:hypothetical protein
MIGRCSLLIVLAGILLIPCAGSPPAPACCPVPPSGKPVVNADQTVIIIWDAANKMQHFIRKASFKSDADDFGFLVPSPNEPELDESGNDAFPYLYEITKPKVITRSRPSGGGCSCLPQAAAPASRGLADKAAPPNVQVLQDKLVAGFHAKVLEAKSAESLVRWLKEHGYAFSPEVEAWVKPYVDAGWKITALKVAKDKDSKAKQDLQASALRMSFKTDRPLFPYREPDTKSPAATLGAKQRLLRIYFLGEGRYLGELTKEVAWTGKVAWTNKLSDEQRKGVLGKLKLAENTGAETLWLTEFEDSWPYRLAPADVYFAPDSDQSTVERPPIIQYVAAPLPADLAIYALAALLVVPPVVRRLRRRG